jgi:SDR family mycofactocin-dependent oxidoreductase
MGKLEGKVAFITGAARGQGRSHAVRLAQEGADIIAVDACTEIATVDYPLSTPEDLAETVRQVEALDRRIIAGQVDVRDGAGLTAAVDKGVAELGRLDVVVANAGIASFAPAEQLTDEAWDAMIDINLSGVFKSVRPTIRHLKANPEGGAIVLTSSTAGLKGIPNIAHYTAAKHGVVGLMKVLANELARYRIRVNTIHPTNVDTPMIMNEGAYRLFRPDLEHPTREDVADTFAGLNAMSVPWVDVLDISEAVLYLVSDSGRYVTGVQLPIDAGMVVR